MICAAIAIRASPHFISAEEMTAAADDLPRIPRSPDWQGQIGNFGMTEPPINLKRHYRIFLRKASFLRLLEHLHLQTACAVNEGKIFSGGAFFDRAYRALNDGRYLDMRTL